MSKKWNEALQSAVLTLGDSQIVTGVSILVSGYIQLACGLQYYHWVIVVDLAFFSSITHLTTLTCLRSYLQKRPAIRSWRLMCMGVTAVLLATALGSTGYYDVVPEWPAQCLLAHNSTGPEGPSGGYDILYTAIVLWFLSFSYLSRVVQLFPSTQTTLRNFFRLRPSNGFQKWLPALKNRATMSSSNSSSNFWLLAHWLLFSLYCLSKALLDLYGSLLWEVCPKQTLSPDISSLTTLKITWLALASAWGTIAVLNDRSQYIEGFDTEGLDTAERKILSEDNTWGFGQIIPLVLLVLPLVSFFEIAYGKFYYL